MRYYFSYFEENLSIHRLTAAVFRLPSLYLPLFGDNHLELQKSLG